MFNPCKIQSVLAALLCMGGVAFAALEPIPASVDSLLAPPKPEQVSAFANDVTLPRDGRWIMVNVKQEKVTEFLAKGEVKPDDHDRGKWFTLTDLTLPDKILNLPGVAEEKKRSEKTPNGQIYFNGLIHAEGVLVTKGGAILYWKLWNDRVLRLSDETGRSCLLVLGKDAVPSAQYLLPYEEYDDAGDPEQKLYGKLTKPKSSDIVAFSNRPEGNSRRDMRNYVSRETLDPCLDAGQVLPILARFDGGMDPFAASLMNDSTAALKQQFTMQGGIVPVEITSSGVLATRDGRVIFWRLYADTALYLMDAKHHTCAMRVALFYNRPGAACFTKFNMNGTARLSSIARSLVAEGDDWLPGKPAPITPEKAIRGAWQELGRAAGGKDASAWRVSMVATSAMNASRFKKWYYVVRFTSQAAGGGDVVIYVSMDGTAGEVNDLELGMKRMGEMRPEHGAMENMNGFRGRGVILD